MEISRRTLSKALPIGFIAAMSAPVAANALAPAPSDEQLKAYKKIERQFNELAEMKDTDVARLAKQVDASRKNPNRPTPYIGLPGPAAIISCILNAAWVFRQGTDKNRIIGQLTEIVVGCVGIPLGSTLTLKLSRIIWDNRTKIIAALSAIGLTAAQLAPLKNAPRP